MELSPVSLSPVPKKHIALYARIGPQEQVSGAESQTRSLVEWCVKNAVSDYKIFCDHDSSGAKENKPALNRLMEKVEAGEVSQVIAFSFSRFAKSTSHFLQTLEKFKSKSVRFRSLKEELDTESPVGLALLKTLGCLSQLERELRKDRLWRV